MPEDAKCPHERNAVGHRQRAFDRKARLRILLSHHDQTHRGRADADTVAPG
jgi:hypothetical protein